MIKMNTVKDIRKYFMTALAYEEFVPDKTGVKTIEMIGAQFVADEPAIFGTVDEDYVKRELEWYRSMSLNVNARSFVPTWGPPAAEAAAPPPPPPPALAAAAPAGAAAVPPPPPPSNAAPTSNATPSLS